jgi:aryl-alcohol dehydrogenase-like predicted oxidoreductase
MQQIMLGTTGEYVSEICLGCMLMGSSVDPATSFTLLDRFVDDGGNFLDTANCYAWWIGSGEFVGDESENTLGQWIQTRKNRDRIFLATKIGARLINPQALRDAHGSVLWDRVPKEREHLTADVIRHDVEDSLRRLQTDHIDLLYIHVDDRQISQEEIFSSLNTLVVEGKVRYIGASNFRTWRFERARGICSSNGWASCVALQQQYSYLRPRPGADFGINVYVDDELLDYLRANEDVSLLAYSPLLTGIYDDSAKREAYYNWPLFNSEYAQTQLSLLSRMAKDLGVTNNQLVLVWILHHQPRVIPILGAKTIDQFDRSIQALAIHLTDEQISLLAL